MVSPPQTGARLDLAVSGSLLDGYRFLIKLMHSCFTLVQLNKEFVQWLLQMLYW